LREITARTAGEYIEALPGKTGSWVLANDKRLWGQMIPGRSIVLH